MVSSPGVAASSTSFPRASRCRYASSGSATRSTRCARSTRRTSGASGRCARRSCYRLPSSCSAPAIKDELVARMNRTVERLPESLQADLERFDSGALGDAAELWGWLPCAPHGARPPGTGHLARRRARRGGHGGRVPALAGRGPPCRAGAGGRVARRAGPRPTPAPREWKTALPEARTLRADVGAGGRGRPAWRQPLRLARAGPAARAHRRPRCHRPSLAGRRRAGGAGLRPVGPALRDPRGRGHGCGAAR